MDLKRTTRTIQSRETWLTWRESNIGASDVAALFGCHPYVTPLQLWAHFRGEAKREAADNAAMRRGRIFENAVLAAYQEENPDLYTWPGAEYHEIPELRLGATPDAWCSRSEGSLGKELIQIKTVTPGKFESEWNSGPPVHHLMQLQAEMLVADARRGRLVAMVMDGFNMPLHEYAFDAEPAYHTGLIHAIRQFWGSVESGEPPRAASGDCETLARLHPSQIPDTTIALGGMPRVMEAIEKKLDAEAKIARLTRDVEGHKATICQALGNHERGVVPGYVINWSTIAPAEVAAYTRKGYRRLTISKERG